MRPWIAVVALFATVPALAQDSGTPIAAWSRTKAVSETTGTLSERGAAVFNNWCDACHRNADQNAPGTRSLDLKYRGELPGALEERTDLTSAFVAAVVRGQRRRRFIAPFFTLAQHLIEGAEWAPEVRADKGSAAP